MDWWFGVFFAPKLLCKNGNHTPGISEHHLVRLLRHKILQTCVFSCGSRMTLCVWVKVIALNEVGNFQRATGAIKRKQPCENRSDDVRGYLLKYFIKILLWRPWLCEVTQNSGINWKGECTLWNLNLYEVFQVQMALDHYHLTLNPV